MAKIDQTPRDFLPFIIKVGLTVIVVIIVGLLAGAIYMVSDILALVFVAYLVALGMNAPIELLVKKCKIKRLLATIIAYIVILSLIISGLIWLIPPLTTQIFELLRNFDYGGFNDQLIDLGFINSLDSIMAQFSDIGKSLFSMIGTTFNHVFRSFMLITVAFHLNMDKGKTAGRIKNITKNAHAAKVYQELADLLNSNLGGWIRGKFILVLFIAVLSYLGYLVLGIKFALPLAIFIGLFDLIPIIGPTVAAVPAIALGFSVSPLIGIITLIFCVIVQQIENVYVIPKVMQKTTHVHPLISIVAILAGLSLFGVFGALVAIPAYIIVRTLYIFFIRDKRHLPS
ncbi:AI-2E family transporter [Microgenomates group bacterium]|nr:AI-2E family transporter [Microgenomates group bacterium]